MEILDLTEEYLEKTEALDRRVFPHSPWGAQSFRGNIENDFDHPVIAVEDGEVLGYGILRLIDVGEILLIGVRPEDRRKGIGKALVKAMLERANPDENVFLEVRESNMAARRLYLSMGFMQTARRRNYYKDPVEDAVIMMV